MNFFRQADFFGTPFTQQIDQNQTIYKSVLGGIVTLTILSASLAYSVWVLFQWKTNQLSPKIQNSLYVSDFQLLALDYEVIQLYFWKFDENRIDPFEAKVLLPMVMYTQDFSFTEPQIINPERTADGLLHYAPKMQLAFQNISGMLYTSSEMYIQIVKCEERFLQQGDKCASQELVDKFYSQSLNMIVLELHYKSLNSQDGQIQSSAQNFYIQIEPQNCYTLNTFLQSNMYQVDKQFLFGEPDYYEFINGAQIQSQTNSLDYCTSAYSAQVISLIYVVMKGNQMKTIFDYPKAGDLLANIGSIVSVLFMVKYVIIFFNEYFVNEKVIKDLINIYYPEYKQIKIKKNWRRKVVEVKVNEKTMEVNDYLKSNQQVRKQLQIKLSYLNMLYEISRLYILIRSKKSREEIRKSHQVGVKLDYNSSDTLLKSYNTNRPGLSSLILTDEDITLISLSEKMKQHDFKKIPDELESLQNEFYNINKII